MPPTPAVQVTPALPWSPGSGGTIQLAKPITFDELLAGKLTFKYAGDGGGEYGVGEYDGAAVLIMGNTNFYAINKWQGRSSTIQVLWAMSGYDPSMPYLSEVIVNPDLDNVRITNVDGNAFLTCTDENGETIFLTDVMTNGGIVAQVNGANEITVTFSPTPVPNGPAQEFPPANYNPIELNYRQLSDHTMKKAMVKKFITDWQEGESSSSYKIKVQARNLVIVPANNLVSGGASPANTSWHAS